MKKVPFIILLVAELIVALIAMGLLLSALGVFSYLVAAVVFTAVLMPFFKKLKHTEKETEKIKIRRKVLLIMLLPTAVAIIVVITVVALLASHYGL